MTGRGVLEFVAAGWIEVQVWNRIHLHLSAMLPELQSPEGLGEDVSDVLL